jgi:hypothetical protein
MKKFVVILLVIFTLLFSRLPVNAKPKLPDPYPLPDIQAEAYPAPGQGLPGVSSSPEPSWPDPRPGIPYCWGGFITSPDGQFRWWMSKIGPTDFDAFVYTRVTIIGDPTQGYDLTLRPRLYSGGIMWYVSDFFRISGDWQVDLGRWDDVPCDIRQPNIYKLRVWMLPNLYKAMLDWFYLPKL